MDFTYRPIGRWPGTHAASRTSSKFKASYADTLALLDRELRQLSARSVVLQLAMSAEDIRLDGRPRANSRASSHPGVILSFDSKFGPLSYPCDTYTSWEDNLRAIALALQALRAVKRYGVGQSGEQYRGWSALPPGRTVEPKMDKMAAINLLQSYHTVTIDNAEECKAGYRAAVKATHPDRGGDPEAFKRVQEAAEVLGVK